MAEAKLGDTVKIHFTGKLRCGINGNTVSLKDVYFTNFSEMVTVDCKCYGQR
jgi:hypothetical protein